MVKGRKVSSMTPGVMRGMDDILLIEEGDLSSSGGRKGSGTNSDTVLANL